MKIKTALIPLLAVLGVAIFLLATFRVDEREKALVLQFGEIVRADLQPGIHFKIPFIQDEAKFDARVQTMDAEPELYLTGEKKNLVVDSFVKWRVRDVHQYYTRLQGRKSNAESRLSQRVNDSLRQEFGQRTVQEVISGDRGKIMNVVRDAMDADAESLGIEIIDVRLKRVDLDPAISERVYERMNAERERVAKELRAQGEEEAEKIRAEADRERQIMLAEAEREGQKLRGEGDAVATEIYASAFGRDREFYNLYRSLNAYKQTFDSPDNLLVLDPSADFFKYFKQSDANQ